MSEEPQIRGPLGGCLGLVVGILVCLGFFAILFGLVGMIGVPMMEERTTIEKVWSGLVLLGGLGALVVAAQLNRRIS